MPEQSSSSNYNNSSSTGHHTTQNTSSSNNGSSDSTHNHSRLPLSTRISTMVLSLQFLWFAGHLITFLHAVYYIFMGTHTSPRSYYKAYYGTFISYLIIIVKGHGTPKISKAYLTQVMMNENTQYLCLAMVWLTSHPLWVSLIPFATFSFFHSLTYIRTQMLPGLFPPGASNLDLSRKISQWIGSFVQKHQTQAIDTISSVEVWFILPYTLLSIFIGKVSLFTFLLYANFLRFRYYFSPSTKTAFHKMRVTVDQYILQNPKSPQFLKSVYSKVKALVIKYGHVAEAQPSAASASQNRTQ